MWATTSATTDRGFSMHRRGLMGQVEESSGQGGRGVPLIRFMKEALFLTGLARPNRMKVPAKKTVAAISISPIYPIAAPNAFVKNGQISVVSVTV